MANKTGQPFALPSLTPFVGSLADAARDRLLEVLALGEHVLDAKVGTRAGGSTEWVAEINVRLPSGRTMLLDLSTADPHRPALFKTANLACGYRSGQDNPFADAGDATFLNGLRDRLTRLDSPAGAAPAVAALLQALDRYRPFLPVKDEDYRIVFLGGAQPVGLLWLGFACNQDCRMCWQGRDWPSPPDEMFERWLDELCAAGLSSLVLSGGEPTLHPLLPRWLARAQRAGLHVTVETNAIRFGEPGYLDELRAAGLGDVVVSLHAADAATSDLLTGVPGSFERTVAGLRKALEAGVLVGVHCVVERANVGALEEHARFVAEDLRVGDRHVRHVSYSFPIAYRRRELYREVIPPLDEVRPHLSAAVRRLRRAQIEVHFLGMSGFPVCTLESPAAEVQQLPVSIPDDQRSDRTFVEPCEDCAVKPRCLGVLKPYAEVHGSRGVVALRRS